MKRFASRLILTVVSVVMGGALIGCSYHDNHYEGRHRHWDHDDRYYSYHDHDQDRWHDRDWRR